jgi:signal transduction histidine kinase
VRQPLPAEEAAEDEEGEDPRAELARQLLESSSEDITQEQAIERLTSAQVGLQAMAGLLERTLRGETPLGDDMQPLGVQVRQIIASCSAMAEQLGVRIDLHLSDAAAALPTGPLGPIILNGLRNAIEACAISHAGSRQVEISIGVNPKQQIEVIIADTGPGLGTSRAKPDGHGVGLELCRHLAEGAGGQLELMNVPFGGGAVLRVLVPIAVKHQQRT